MVWPFTTGKLMKPPSPPAGLEDFASYTTRPGAGDTQAAGYYDGKLPEFDDGYFPTIGDQDAILVHWDRPPADQNPQAWWVDRTTWQQQEDQNTHIAGPQWVQQTGQTSRAADSPYAVAPEVTRPTAHQSPSDYKYLRPFGQDTEHELTGIHYSMADNKIAYLIGQMASAPSFQNTYRVQPPTNDASAVLYTADDGTAVLAKFNAPEQFSDAFALGGSS